MKIIGITGGIGSGKSTVCEIFKTLGIPVYQSDDRAKFLMENDLELVNQVKATFGQESYDGSRLNRPYLAKKVFTDPEATVKINSMVHPSVRRDFHNWVVRQSSPYVIKEAALLIESGSYKNLDFLINVSVPVEIRIARIQKRDPQRSIEEINGIIDKQVSEEKRIELAQKTINNDGNSLLIPQVLAIHKKFIKGTSQ